MLFQMSQHLWSNQVNIESEYESTSKKSQSKMVTDNGEEEKVFGDKNFAYVGYEKFVSDSEDQS
jgi:hypothetical protein